MFVYAVSLINDPLHNFVSHWDDMLLGATFVGILGHALDSFPVPENRYGKWALGVAQFIIGQRLKAQVSMQDNRGTAGGSK